MKAWHFLRDDGRLRDGKTPPPDGETLSYSDDLELCNSGLHASKRLIDALQYSPGSILCRVECGGTIIKSDDKLVCSERTILWRMDTTAILRDFARRCALDVVHLWDAPEIVISYLQTGDENIRETVEAAEAAAGAAEAAAWAAAGAAAWAAWAAEAAAGAAWAAEAAAEAAAWAAQPATVAARAAARAKQNRRLTAMVAMGKGRS